MDRPPSPQGSNVIAELDERKALDRLGRSLRNLISGDRLGADIPPPEDAEAEPPAESQAPQPPPQALNPPPGQS